MADRLPIIYGLIVLLETVALLYRYVVVGAPASSEPLSIWLGWSGLAAMIIMLIYSVARRSRAMKQWARLSYWLHFHIFMGVQGVLLTIFHSSHIFHRETPMSWLNPGLLCFIAVMVVFFSGLFGRYMYSWLPRTIVGDRMAVDEAQSELRALDAPVPEAVQARLDNAKEPTGFISLLIADFELRAIRRECIAAVDDPRTRDLVDRRLTVQRRLHLVRVAERLFRLWIIAHRPMAGIMYVLAAVHIVLSYMFTPGL